MSTTQETTDQAFMQQRGRKLAIQAALARLKHKNQQFMFKLESNHKWRKIYNGLLYNNKQAQLSQLIGLELCQANDNDDSAFFNPFQKIPITMCYNKINQQQNFQKNAIFNLVLLYDARVRPNINWNELKDTAKSTIRALNISGICGKNDKQCYFNEVKQRVLSKQRFKGKQLDFDQVYNAGIQDMSPISQIS